MTDTAPAPAPAPKGDTLTSPPKDSKAQMLVALSTVIALTLIAIGAFVVTVICRNESAVVVAAVAIPSVVVGALANSLAAPTGIATVIGAAGNGSKSGS